MFKFCGDRDIRFFYGGKTEVWNFRFLVSSEVFISDHYMDYCFKQFGQLNLAVAV